MGFLDLGGKNLYFETIKKKKNQHLKYCMSMVSTYFYMGWRTEHLSQESLSKFPMIKVLCRMYILI